MRYTRQIQLFGADNQQKLLESKVLVVGVGGLGCPLLQLLSSVGVGTLGLVDFDKVEAHNLHRQFLFDEACVGMLKTDAAVARLRARNPQTVLHAYPYALTADNVFSTIADYDVVVDGTDNFSVRYLLSDACAIARKPLVYGALYHYEGQVSVFNVEKDGYTTSYRDLFPVAPQPNELTKIKYNMTDKNAPSTAEEVKQFNYPAFCHQPVGDELTTVEALDAFLAQEKAVLVDVREEDEQPKIDRYTALSLPLSVLPTQWEQLKAYDHICFVCVAGVRSMKALNFAKEVLADKDLKSFKQGFSPLVNV